MEILWRAFELRPDPVPKRDPNGEYLERVWRESVYPLAERLGMTMRLPPIQPRSRRAHEAAKWAQTQNRFDAYNQSIFRAFFERGEDIESVDVLIKLAGELQLDESSLRVALNEKLFEAAVIADENEATRIGVHAVPAFVANRQYALSGVQTLTALTELIERARASISKP